MQIKPITYNLAVDEPAGLFVLSCQRILIEIKISSERKVLPFQTVPFFNLQNDKIWHKNRAFTVKVLPGRAEERGSPPVLNQLKPQMKGQPA